MDIVFIIFIVFVFIAAFFGLEALTYWWAKHLSAETVRLKKRILTVTGHERDGNIAYQSILKNRYESEENVFLNYILSLPVSDKVNTYLLQSGKFWSLKKFINFSIGSACALFFVAIFFTSHVAFLLLAFVIGFFLPLFYILHLRNKRFMKLEEQLPMALDSICRSLKAGHSFSTAFNMVGEEFADPIASEFRITIEENKLGVNMTDAMSNMAKRIPITDFAFFVIAVSIQRETGGNLAEILGNISLVIRERFKLFRHIKVISAEGRMSASVLAAMPFVMMALLSWTNPKYGELLFHTPEGQYMLKIAATLMVVAIFWMRNVVKIKV